MWNNKQTLINFSSFVNFYYIFFVFITARIKYSNAGPEKECVQNFFFSLFATHICRWYQLHSRLQMLHVVVNKTPANTFLPAPGGTMSPPLFLFLVFFSHTYFILMRLYFMALDCDSFLYRYFSRRRWPAVCGNTTHPFRGPGAGKNKQKQTAAEDRIHHISTTSREKTNNKWKKQKQKKTSVYIIS